MTKAEIVGTIAKRTGIDRVSVLASLESFMDVVTDTLSQGENVYLRGFGTFGVKYRKAKPARDIKNQTTITIAARNVPIFKPSQHLSAKVSRSLPADK
ncbi:MAG: integration host factor subunit beta [Candidatus Symbiothrix sp.]|jgi:DNA-binding protein HU-beta|nr:integration host factor subunit beta [Candidatus Symbiothrix sp.]